MDANPDYLDEKLTVHEKTGEFDHLRIVQLAVTGKEVRNALYPEPPIPVVQAD